MRKAIILSGVSGSGKSTYAEKLLQQSQGVKVSADHFFMKYGVSAEGKQTEAAVYHFDPSKLQEAHNDCFRRFVGFLMEGWSDIVVDNTNTMVWELSPYMLAASAFGYAAEIRTLWVHSTDLTMAWKRNIHKVPLGVLDSQSYNLANRVLPKHWPHTDIDVTF